MNIIKPSTEELFNPNPQKHIEFIARTCYKSEDKITEDSNKAMCKNLYKNKHWAMLEHFIFIYKINKTSNFKSNFVEVLSAEKYIDVTEQIIINERRTILSFNARSLLDLLIKYKDHEQMLNDLIMLIEKIVYDYDCDEIFGNRFKKVDHDNFIKIDDVTILTPIEQFIHGWHSIKFICDRGISHEIVRHRDASFAQESTRYCVTGDTAITKHGLTIRELYDNKIKYKSLKLCSCNEDGIIVSDNYNEVYYNGIKPVYKVTTKLGYTIKATLDHEFMISPNSYCKLSDLKIGDNVLVNGRPCLLNITDDELQDLYINKHLSINEISNLLMIPYRTINRKLHQLGIFKNHLNDKDKNKYNKNHTQSSYDKMSQTIKNQYNNGRVVWNKNLSEHDNESVKKQANALRKYHYNNKSGEANSNWKDGGGIHYQKLLEHVKNCEICNSTKNLEVHHKDKNRRNNSIDNLIKVCAKCHKYLHLGYRVNVKANKDTIVNIEYIGEEDVYDIEMNNKYHNYVANKFIIHNCNYSKDKYGKEITVIKPFYLNDGSNASTNEIAAYGVWEIAMRESEKAYFEMLDLGYSAQEARIVLPTNLKTELIMTAKNYEWNHFFELRADKPAHPQMKELAIPLLIDFTNRFPELFKETYSKIKELVI